MITVVNKGKTFDSALGEREIAAFSVCIDRREDLRILRANLGSSTRLNERAKNGSDTSITLTNVLHLTTCYSSHQMICTQFFEHHRITLSSAQFEVMNFEMNSTDVQYSIQCETNGLSVFNEFKA